MTTQTLKHIDPLSCARISAVIYGLMGCIVIPFAWMGLLFGRDGSGFIVIIFPILYAIGGFIGGLIGSALYNLVAGWMGGVKIQLGD